MTVHDETQTTPSGAQERAIRVSPDPSEALRDQILSAFGLTMGMPLPLLRLRSGEELRGYGLVGAAWNNDYLLALTIERYGDRLTIPWHAIDAITLAERVF